MNKVAVFVDVQNIYYTVKSHFHCHFNYDAFWRQIISNNTLVAANAYAISPQDNKQAGFQQILKDIGFQVKLKPFIQRNDGSAKGDWDVGITIDIMETAELVDTIILASGDGDFDRLLTTIKKKYNTKSIVYGVAELTANSLIAAADQFIPINESILLR